MKKLYFSADISAPKEKVWKALWDDSNYRNWTRVFSEGSHAVTDWKEGSKVLFLSANGEGMYSVIAKNTPYELMSFRHLGVVKGGTEKEMDEETKKWSGAMENYTLKEMGGVTRLTVDMDVAEEFESYFKDTFPRALNKVKALSEKLPVENVISS